MSGHLGEHGRLGSNDGLTLAGQPPRECHSSTNRIEDVDGLVDEIDQIVLRAQMARFGVAEFDERAATRIATDAVDAAAGIQQIAVAVGDVAATVRADHHVPPNDLARAYRKSLADGLRDLFDDDAQCAELLRIVGQDIARLLTARRESRVKAAQDRAKDEENRRFLVRLKEADDSPEALIERFAVLQRQQTDTQGSLAERAAQRENLAQREAIEHGFDPPTDAT